MDAESKTQTNSKIKKTTQRILTRRGVLWLGQTCNLRCQFCYFLDRVKAKDHPEHPFMSFDKARQICSTLVNTYGNNAIDIQGGEPTIYPQINELVSHCREIGLLPTLITNALVLDKKEACTRLVEAGIRDLLISVHGVGQTYESIVGVPGAYKKQQQALENIIEANIPFRFNCVLAKSILPELKDVARLAINTGARAVNFITFNPFEDQQNNQRSLANVPSYLEVAPYLMEAMDILDEAGIECNARYYPLCMLDEKYRKQLYNFQQLPYDLHEWDYASWSWTGQNNQRMKSGELTPVVTLREANAWSNEFGGNETYLTDSGISTEDEYQHSAFIRAREHCSYKYSQKCKECSLKIICDGFNGDYASLFSADEAKPVELKNTITDPRYYINSQNKIVEQEDWDWAL